MQTKTNEHVLQSIPISFFKYLRGQNGDKAVLRASAGKVWHVKVNGRRFQDGWEIFAKDHDLHVGDFLVFRHEGDVVFNVLVFDPSTCQREYLSFDIKEEIITSQEEDLPDGSGLGEHTKNRQVRTNIEGKTGSSLEPPYFLVKLSSLPPECVEWSNGLWNKCCTIVHMDREGRSWRAKLGYKNDGQESIRNGWTAFRIANGLKMGDSFIFELIQKGKEPILKMRRLKEQTGHVTQAGPSSRRYPHFYVTMKPTHFKSSRLKFPRTFAKKNTIVSKCSKIILVNERGSSWVVSVGKIKSSDIYIGHGWIEFAKANALREGHVFMLELIKKGKKPVMRFNEI